MNFSSIRSKLLGLVAFTSFLMLVIVLFVVPPRTKALASEVMEENAVYTAGLLSENLALGMQTLVLDNGETIQQTLNLLSKGKGAANFIEKVAVFDEQGNFIRGLNCDALAKRQLVDKLKVEHQKRLLVVQVPMKDSGGKLVGFAEIVFSKVSILDKIAAFTRFIWILGLLVLALLIGVGIVISNSITRPVNQAIEMLRNIATGEGDLTKRLTVDARGEIGELARWFNSFVEKVQAIIIRVNENTQLVAGSSRLLTQQLTQMATTSDGIYRSSETVASAAQNASTVVNNISQSAERMSGAVGMVASAIEQMNSTLNEIARNCQQEFRAVVKANAQARTTEEMITKLDGAAGEINKIVEVINDISDQTNLLALNATIEAASAGDAGKGFAVVANEVKALARQTAQETDGIATQIEEMQRVSEASMKAIEDIKNVVEEVNTISQVIVSAVEEQTVTTREIAKSVGGASNSAREIASDVQGAAGGLTQVSSNIQNVNRGVGEVSAGINELSQSARQLDQYAEELKKIVNLFKT